jgi:prevent-host-death family protein
MDVGVRELKQHLSSYLDRVERGETIRVTDRGKPKALLMPFPGDDPLRRGIDEGWIRPPVVDAPLEPVQPLLSSSRVLDLLADDRDG